MKISKERLIIYILCFLFLLVGFFVTLGFKDAKQCLGNPFTYGANEIENEETGDLSCTCYFESQNYAPFYFNNKEVEVLRNLPIISVEG